MESLTEELDEKAAIVDQSSRPANLDVHLDKHLGLIQVADEQHLPVRRREGSEWAAAAAFVSVQDRGRDRNTFGFLMGHLNESLT